MYLEPGMPQCIQDCDATGRASMQKSFGQVQTSGRRCIPGTPVERDGFAKHVVPDVIDGGFLSAIYIGPARQGPSFMAAHHVLPADILSAIVACLKSDWAYRAKQ